MDKSRWIGWMNWRLSMGKKCSFQQMKKKIYTFNSWQMIGIQNFPMLLSKNKLSLYLSLINIIQILKKNYFLNQYIQRFKILEAIHFFKLCTNKQIWQNQFDLTWGCNILNNLSKALSRSFDASATRSTKSEFWSFNDRKWSVMSFRLGVSILRLRSSTSSKSSETDIDLASVLIRWRLIERG